MPREEEEIEAVRGGTSGELRAAQVGGDLRGTLAARRRSGSSILGLGRTGEKGREQERKQRSSGGLLIEQWEGGPGSTACGEEGIRGMATVALLINLQKGPQQSLAI